jgi:hypothetical protein
MDKFNGQNFDLWKLNMEYLPVDRDPWVFVSGKQLMGMEKED